MFLLNTDDFMLTKDNLCRVFDKPAKGQVSNNDGKICLNVEGCETEVRTRATTSLVPVVLVGALVVGAY